jgi:hypothetical protein
METSRTFLVRMHMGNDETDVPGRRFDVNPGELNNRNDCGSPNPKSYDEPVG